MVDDIFAATTPAIDPAKDYTSELVGEGKKYATTADLARAAMHKDLFINKLEAETKELRDEVATRMKMEEFVDRMNSLETRAPVTNQEPDRSQSVTPPPVATVKPEEVDALLEAKLAERDKVNAQKRNMMEVVERLRERFGDGYAGVVEERANKLGLGKEFLNNLALTQPKAFYAVIGVDTPTRADNPASGLRSQVNSSSQAFQPSTQEKTAKYYDTLRKTDRSKYLSQEVQVEMHKQAIKLGADFFDQ